VALKYDESLPAPFLVAKGAGSVAERMRDLAEELNIPILRDSDLSGFLFPFDPGQMVPEAYWEWLLRYTFLSRSWKEDEKENFLGTDRYRDDVYGRCLYRRPEPFGSRGVPVKQKDLDMLQKWGITSVFTEGSQVSAASWNLLTLRGPMGSIRRRFPETATCIARIRTWSTSSRPSTTV
jgi:type III secretion system FlhB-like substrate exporter